MVLGTLLYVILVIIAIVILLLKFLFQLFLIIPLATGYHAGLLSAKEILLIIVSWTSTTHDSMFSCNTSVA